MESTKYTPVNNNNNTSDFKFTTFRTKKSKVFAYFFISFFVAFTVFLAFNPSPNPSSPWFYNIFTKSTTSQANSTTTTSDSVRSQFSSIYSYLFANNSSSSKLIPNSLNNSIISSSSHDDDSGYSIGLIGSPTWNSDDVEVNRTRIRSNRSAETSRKPDRNVTGVGEISKPETVGLNKENVTGNGEKSKAENVGLKEENVTESVKNVTGNGEESKAESVGLDKENVTGNVKNVTGNGEESKAERVGLKEENVTGSDLVKDLKNVTGIGEKSKTETAGLKNESVTEIVKNATGNGEKLKAEKVGLKNENVTGSRNSANDLKNATGIGEKLKEDLVKDLMNCNMFDGEWIRDESYPLYKPGSCLLIDEQFNCFVNGRPDKGFQMLKWKPKSCTLPRLDGSNMLELLRGKRLVFVGDSLNRNMWESLICILRNSVKDQTRVYEASGRHHFRTEASYSFVFKDYNCTVEFFVAPFIVRESETKDKNGAKKETLRLDLVGASADQYKHADIVVFNTGHWWTHEKTAKGKDYYQEGSHVYNELNVLEAFRKAMTTWGRWVDANINPSKTSVFFRGYSASHFRGGQWNSGGQCDNEVEPIKNTTYLSPYPDKMKVLEKVLKGMKTRVSYLNITRLTDFRKDGHPSIYRKQHYSEEERRSPLHFQDCSHWCLPGVPDSWNEILYAQLLAKQYQTQQQKH